MSSICHREPEFRLPKYLNATLTLVVLYEDKLIKPEDLKVELVPKLALNGVHVAEEGAPEL